MNTKAKELVDKFYYTLPNNGLQVGVNNVNSRWQEAKKCALIAVDELIQLQGQYNHGNPFPSNYWLEVKTEIEKL